MILHTYVDHDQRRTSIDSWVKCQGQIWTSDCLPFSHAKSFSLSFTMMILHTCVDQDQRRTCIDFSVKRSEVSVKFGLQTFYCFRTATPFPFGIQWWYFTCVGCDPRMTSWFFGQEFKGRGYISCLKYTLFPHPNSNTFGLTIMIHHTCISYDPRWAHRSRLNLQSLNLLPPGGGGICPFRAGLVHTNVVHDLTQEHISKVKVTVRT